MFINRLSESKSNTYIQCKLKYKYTYVDRYIEDPGDTSHLNFGSYIHKIYEIAVLENKTDIDSLRKVAKEIKKQFNFSSSYDDKVDICLKNFCKFNKNITSENIGCELKYLVEIDTDMSLDGIIDRIEKSGDKYLIIDYKTGKREQTKVTLYQNTQLQGYAFAIHKMFNVPLNKIVCGHYYPLTNNFVSVTYNTAQILKYLKNKKRQIWEIRKARLDDLQPQKNEFCNWCGYKTICPLYNSATEVKERLECRQKKEPRQYNEDEEVKIPLTD